MDNSGMELPQGLIFDLHSLEQGSRVRLYPNDFNPLHKKAVEATYRGGYFFCDGSDPFDGPDYYLGDVLTYNHGWVLIHGPA